MPPDIAAAFTAQTRYSILGFSLSVFNALHSGEWLLDSRLMHKKLDIRIRGTRVTRCHNARYENECGFVIPDKKFTSVDDSIVVKVGYNQSRLYFPLRHIYPEVTTERPNFIARSVAIPVARAIGERVVIIGADLEGKMDLLGNYALVIHCIWALDSDQVCLQVLMPRQSDPCVRYFPEKSLCRSHVDDH